MGLGVNLVDLPTESAPLGTIVVFTFFWLEAKRWGGSDFAVGVISPRLDTELELKTMLSLAIPAWTISLVI